MTFSRRDFVASSLALCTSAIVDGRSSLLAHVASSALSQQLEIIYANPKTAQYTMLFASPYSSEHAALIPHMHLEIKQAVETFSKGQIFVDIRDNGQLGVGTGLMAAITRHQITAALISVSNLSRAVPVLDILNIPFWASKNQAFLNLISSPIWQELVLDKIKQQGKLEVLMHYLVGARTLTSSKHLSTTFKTPDDLHKRVLRVPASKVLAHFYKMTPAHVVDVPWHKVASLIRNGQIDALDPGIIGLYAGPDGLNLHLGVINQLASVPDTWVAVVDQTWMGILPKHLQRAVREAFKHVFKLHAQSVSVTKQKCVIELAKLGTQIYTPTIAEQTLWIEQFGHHNPTWKEVKKDLLGSEKAFDELVAATEITSAIKLG